MKESMPSSVHPPHEAQKPRTWFRVSGVAFKACACRWIPAVDMTAGTIPKVVERKRKIEEKRVAQIRAKCLAIAAYKKINSHGRAHQDDEGLHQACGSFCAKCAVEYPPSSEPAVMTMACGQTMARVIMKVTVATPLMTPPRITLSLFMAWMSVIPSAASIARFMMPMPPPK